MKTTHYFKQLALLLSLSLITISCNNDDDGYDTPEEPQSTTITALASESDDLSILVSALQAAGLDSTLDSEGSFTVFAPTNAAFAKLPAGTVETLLKAENKATLAKILTYHVVAGSLNATAVLKAIKDGGGSVTLKTVSGGSLVASVKAGKVILTDEKGGVATVVATDLGASNGLIHVIDTVVLPK